MASGQPVKNKDEFVELDELLQDRSIDVEFVSIVELFKNCLVDTVKSPFPSRFMWKRIEASWVTNEPMNWLNVVE